MSKKPQLPLPLEPSSDRFHMGSSCLLRALPSVTSTAAELLSAGRWERTGPELVHSSIPMAGLGGIKMSHHPSCIIPPSFFRLEMLKGGEEEGRLFCGGSSWEPYPRSSRLVLLQEAFLILGFWWQGLELAYKVQRGGSPLNIYRHGRIGGEGAGNKSRDPVLKRKRCQGKTTKVPKVVCPGRAGHSLVSPGSPHVSFLALNSLLSLTGKCFLCVFSSSRTHIN